MSNTSYSFIVGSRTLVCHVFMLYFCFYFQMKGDLSVLYLPYDKVYTTISCNTFPNYNYLCSIFRDFDSVDLIWGLGIVFFKTWQMIFETQPKLKNHYSSKLKYSVNLVNYYLLLIQFHSVKME